MRAKDRIQQAAKAANLGGRVYKGNDVDGARGYRYGWWLKGFALPAIFLGTSERAALKMIDRLSDS